jgi:hypothetical protein
MLGVVTPAAESPFKVRMVDLVRAQFGECGSELVVFALHQFAYEFSAEICACGILSIHGGIAFVVGEGRSFVACECSATISVRYGVLHIYLG